jgi:hypothetical protein
MRTLWQTPIAGKNFSATDSGENFIRSDFLCPEPVPRRLIDVLLEPAILLEFPDEANGIVG